MSILLDTYISSKDRTQSFSTSDNSKTFLPINDTTLRRIPWSRLNVEAHILNVDKAGKGYFRSRRYLQ
jgi:hypothetical protein